MRATVLMILFVFLSHIKFSFSVKEAVLGSGEMAGSSFRSCRGLKPWPLQLQRTWLLQTTAWFYLRFFFLLELGQSPCNIAAVDRMCLFFLLFFLWWFVVHLLPSYFVFSQGLVGPKSPREAKDSQSKERTVWALHHWEAGKWLPSKACMGAVVRGNFLHGGCCPREFPKRASFGGGRLSSLVCSHQDWLIYKGSFLWGSQIAWQGSC